MDARRRRIIAFTFIAVAVVLGAALSWAWQHTALGEKVTIEAVAELIEAVSAKWWAPLLVALLYTPACLVLFPRPLLTVAAVIVFGPIEGFALAMAGIITSALILYGAGTRMDEKAMRRLAGPKADRLKQMLSKGGFTAIALVGMLPLAPFSMEMFAAGAMRIKLRDVVAGVALAHLPGTIATTVLGDQVVAAIAHEREINRAIIVGAVLVFVALAVGSWRMWRRIEAQ